MVENRDTHQPPQAGWARWRDTGLEHFKDEARQGNGKFLLNVGHWSWALEDE